jgi:integrase
VPDVAPVLALGAVTGMRRGELVGIRRSKIDWHNGRLTVDTAIGSSGRVKTTKTRTERSFYVDRATLAMLRRHCDAMDERAHLCGCEVAPDGFVFSLAPDCSTPMPADHLTKRVAVLKDHLGVPAKRAETIRLEDEALGLYRRTRRPRTPGKTGPAPRGGMSFREIGERLGRSERWAVSAVASAQRRENAAARMPDEFFDASVVALRKFTSSELLDAGFNISMVAARQGHGPQVLVKHYAKSRRSADRRAAEHLGAIVYRGERSRSESDVEEPFERAARDDDASTKPDAGQFASSDERVRKGA